MNLSQADLERMMAKLSAMERIPTVRKGMNELRMRSLSEWFRNPERFIDRQNRACHPLHKPYLFSPGLRARMFYEPSEFSWAARVEAAAPRVIEELEHVLASRSGFQPYRMIENAQFLMSGDQHGHERTDKPEWNMFYFYHLGVPVAANVARCPQTAALLRSIPRFTSSSIACFSALNPQTHIYPHYGPQNAVLRVHLGLRVPSGCRIRVGTETRTWEQGKLMVFSDAFEHEVWHEGQQTRIVLFFDVLHPDWQDSELGSVEECLRDFTGMKDALEVLERLRANDADFLHGTQWWK